MSNKNESLQKYLDAGGKITICPPARPEDSGKNQVRSTVVKSVVSTLTYEEADILYGIKTERKKEKKEVSPKVAKRLEELKKGIEALPKELRDKLKKDL